MHEHRQKVAASFFAILLWSARAAMLLKWEALLFLGHNAVSFRLSDSFVTRHHRVLLHPMRLCSK